MKRTLANLMLIIAIALTLTSCMTNERKALRIIDDYMKSYLIVYGSYKPQATKIDTAYYSPVFDVTTLAHAKNAIDAEDRYNEALESLDRAEEEANSARRSMALWSGSYDAFCKEQYNQYARKLKTVNADIKKFTDASEVERQTIISEENLIKESAAKVPSGVCGWCVQHSYTCKTRGGDDTAGFMIFIINKEFSEILFACDNEDEETLKYINKIKSVLELE